MREEVAFRVNISFKLEFLPSCSQTFTPFISDVMTPRLGVKRLSNILSASDRFANELQTP